MISFSGLQQEDVNRAVLSQGIRAYCLSKEYKVVPGTGRYPAEITAMFHAVYPGEAGCVYVEPDSANTRIWYLDPWELPWEEQVIMIETDAGIMCDSCGSRLSAGKYDEDTGRWYSMVDECGKIDMVYSLQHRGLNDFSITDQSGNTRTRYRYNGETYEGIPEFPVTDTGMIAVLVQSKLHDSEYSYIREDLLMNTEWNILHLDSSACRYLFLQCGMTGAFILCEEQPHVFSLVNFFESEIDVNILPAYHNGKPDIRTFNLNYCYHTYRWDGKKYVLHDKEEWVCPR